LAPHLHPSPGEITACPSSWYLVDRSSSLAPGQICHATIGGQDLVLFRGADDGQVHALAAHCMHMGCHLKGGTVIGDRIRCPLHFRQFDGAGRVRSTSSTGPSRDLPVQPTYPVLERFGAIFVFLGPEAAFEFPAPHQQSPERYVTLVTAPFEFPLPWYALIANGCDLDHLQAVHLRRLKEPPRVGPLAPSHFQIRYRSEVIGDTLPDRVMKRISGNDIRATITSFGGSLMQVESSLRGRRSFLLLSMRPRGEGTSVQGVVGLSRCGNALWDQIRIRTAAWLFLSFLKRDLSILDGLRLHRPSPPLTDGDRYICRLFDYFHGLDRPLLGVLSQKAADR
jgi:phenylpropionate dioxygenase-like ring-hydroxylating dioxygenase large terminal subunit